jgi:hypothetical protein
MSTDTTYKSNSNIRRKITLRFTQPQLDALVEVFSIGEEHAEEYHIPARTVITATRAMDVLMEAWNGEEAA